MGDDGRRLDEGGASLVVLGVGGGGCNAVDTMVARGVMGVETVAVNTDAQALGKSAAQRRFQLGRDLTRGLGAGARPEVGRDAALADRERLAELVHGRDLVFVVAGLGGGTGTGAAPVVAEVCREAGALTVGIATLPFGFEGRRRARVARDGLAKLAEQVDTLITIPNDRLLSLSNGTTRMQDAFGMVEDVMVRGVGAVSSLVRGAGRINVDFADVRTVMGARGPALLGVGDGQGDHRLLRATHAAIASPLLEDAALGGARHVLLNIRGPGDLGLHEVSEAATLVQEVCDDEVNLIWGWVVDDALDDCVEVTVLATGFGQTAAHPVDGAWRRGETARAGSRRVATAPRGEDDVYDVPQLFKNAD